MFSKGTGIFMWWTLLYSEENIVQDFTKVSDSRRKQIIKKKPKKKKMH